VSLARLGCTQERLLTLYQFLTLEILGRQLDRQSGLRYVVDQGPGFTRQKIGRGFSYFNTKGQWIRDRQLRDRPK
jgi:DNA topoisomerase IB